MSAFSNYLETAIINATLRNTTYTSPANVYVALFTTDPTDAASGTECTGTSYARTAVSTTGGFVAPTNGVTSNVADVVFPTAGGAWGTITHFGIFDAATVGNLMYHGALTAPKIVANAETFRAVATSLVITLL